MTAFKTTSYREEKFSRVKSWEVEQIRSQPGSKC